MSYLEPGQRRLKLLAALATSLKPDPGCARCGASLAQAVNLGGHCGHCAVEVSAEDDVFDTFAIRRGHRSPFWG
jgi:hypothetical protein